MTSRQEQYHMMTKKLINLHMQTRRAGSSVILSVDGIAIYNVPIVYISIEITVHIFIIKICMRYPKRGMHTLAHIRTGHVIDLFYPKLQFLQIPQ